MPVPVVVDLEALRARLGVTTDADVVRHLWDCGVWMSDSGAWLASNDVAKGVELAGAVRLVEGKVSVERPVSGENVRWAPVEHGRAGRQHLRGRHEQA